MSFTIEDGYSHIDHISEFVNKVIVYDENVGGIGDVATWDIPGDRVVFFAQLKGAMLSNNGLDGVEIFGASGNVDVRAMGIVDGETTNLILNSDGSVFADGEDRVFPGFAASAGTLALGIGHPDNYSGVIALACRITIDVVSLDDVSFDLEELFGITESE